MFELLFTPLLAAHLMCVNVASAGPMVCLWLEWRESRGDRLAGNAARYLAVASLVLLIAGSLLGILLAALMWTEAYRDVLLVRLKSRVSFGVWEWLFSVVLMAIYCLWQHWAPGAGKAQRGLRALLPLLAGTNLLYHFPLLFIIASNLSAAGSQPDAVMTSAEFRAAMAAGDVPARVVHFLLAAFAMCGVALLGYGLRLARLGGADDDVRRISAYGGRIALAPTLLQIPVGLWLVARLPHSAQRTLMGGDLLAAALFGISLLAAFGLMHHLSTVALGAADRRQTIRAAWLMGIVVVLMTAMMQRAL